MTVRIMRFTKLLLGLGLAACAWPLSGQNARQEIYANPDKAGGVYYAYTYDNPARTPAPEGYKPFYISHYGRHGSRYHSKEEAYAEPLAALRKADKAGALTPKGREVLAKVEMLAADACKRYGDLSPRGVQEHRDIAGRMFAAYPGVFSTDGGRVCRIESRSTQVPRCILSMAAFNERLKELNPAISATRDASARDLCYLANGPSLKASRKAASAVADSLTRVRVNPDRFVKSLVTDPGCIDEPLDLMEDLFMLAAITQDVSHLGIKPFYEIFTEKELYALWECENLRRYLIMGPSARFGDPLVADARPLLRNIVETADRVVAGESDLSASLRFGHDTYVVPLLALLRAEGACARVESLDDVAAAWNAHTVTPMGTNVQFIFFRNPETGDVRVRVLHNERDANLPLAGGPYYPWKELKKYCESLYGAKN